MSRKSFNCLIAVLYALLITNIPWDVIRGVQFEDYLNYIQRINDLKSVGASYINPKGTMLGALTSESLWGYLLLAVANSSIDPSYFLGILSFVNLSVIAYFVLKNIPTIAGIVLLTNPLMIDLVMSQHRNALVVSLLICAIITDKKFIYYLSAAISPFIHTASLIIFPGYLFCKIIGANFATNNFFQKKTIVIFTGFILGFALTIGREFLLESIGDRRTGHSAGSVSFLYASFWYFLLASLLIFHRKTCNPIFYFSIFNLVIFTWLTLFNAYSARFLTIAYPFIIICIFNLKKDVRLLLLALLIFYQSAQWYFWI